MTISSINNNSAALTQATGTASQALPKVSHHHHHTKTQSADSADSSTSTATEGTSGAASPAEDLLPPASAGYNATGSSTATPGGSTFSALA